jgi:hypothetical protein
MGHVFGAHALHLMHGVMRRRGGTYLAAPTRTGCDGATGRRGDGEHSVGRSFVVALLATVLLAACGTAPQAPVSSMQTVQAPPPLPDSGWGVHVLSMRTAPNRATWVGSWDGRLFRIPFRGREWEVVTPATEAPGPINSIAFESDSMVVWYGTAGGGFARSADGGKTWRAWPQATGSWSHVVPRGILVRRDTVFVATTDGLRYTGDAGVTWTCVQAPRTAGAASATAPTDACTQRLETLPGSGYILSMELQPRDGTITIGHLQGLSRSTDRGRTWTIVSTEGLAGERVRSVRIGPDSMIWALTERALYADSPRFDGFRHVPLRVPGYPELPGRPRAIISQPGDFPLLVATSYGMLGETATGGFRMHFLSAADRWRPAGDIWTGLWWGPPMIPIGGSTAGLNRILAGEAPVPPFIDAPLPAEPAAGHHLRFTRPVRDDEGNPYSAGTELYGMTPVRGTGPAASVLFANPPGTTVRSIGSGVVVRAEVGRVVVRHDAPADGRTVFSVYQTGGPAQAAAGQRVEAGAPLASVGRDVATAGVRLSLHALTPADTALARTAPSLPASSNPALWLEPLTGTGVVAGRVLSAAGDPVRGAEVHGLVVPYPTEAPFSRAVTYPAPGFESPAYNEHFAVGDVPAGTYLLGVTIQGQRVWRRVRVSAGQVSWVEFRPN